MGARLENENNLTIVGEKLYMDSYLSILKSHADVTFCTRDMVRQIPMHCETLNIKLNSQDIITQSVIEYFKIVDESMSLGLIPIASNSENFSLPETLEDDVKISALNDICCYLERFDLNQSPAILLNRNHISTEKCVKSKLSNQALYASTNQNLLRSNKRPAEDSPKLNSPIKRRSILPSKKTNSIEQSREKISNNFVSASSMYKNPLAKTKCEVKKDDSPIESSAGDHIKNHESLKIFDKKIVTIILNEIMDFSPNINWSDIAGLSFVKNTVQEIVIWPLMRPDIFTGLRAPPRGILLFGPPGTGKTLIGKCIATESNSTFFCISSSSLASKWVGESEQLVRALFAIARLHQPAVIFVDEIDSLLSQRSDKDQDFTRKLKTEFLVQFDGAKTKTDERVLVVGATNRPHELDEAARRRFVKRLYVPLPDESARHQIVVKLLSENKHDLSEGDFQEICAKTQGYSGSDVAHLCKEAAMGPIRSIAPKNIKTVSLTEVRAIKLEDFIDALRQVRASVAQDDLDYYSEWNKKFGSFGL